MAAMTVTPADPTDGSAPDSGPVPGLAGVILAGGRSRRMGTDKAALDWDGRPMLAVITETVRQRCEPVLVVASPESAAYQGLAEGGTDQSLTWVTDEFPGAGPLGGLAAGLAAAARAGASAAFVCATDMPLIEAALIDEMLRGFTDSAQVLLARDEQRDHPMAALYRTELAGPVADLVAAGERRMLAVTEHFETHRVGVSRPTWLTNVNAPDDLHRWRRDRDT